MRAAVQVLLVLFSSGAAWAQGRGPRYVDPTPINTQEHTGWQSMFDGRSLHGWDGPTDVWRVENGEIVAAGRRASLCNCWLCVRNSRACLLAWLPQGGSVPGGVACSRGLGPQRPPAICALPRRRGVSEVPNCAQAKPDGAK
jgi:hypothetical protein